MDTAETYLRRLYNEIHPAHVVEIGADPQMLLAARTSLGIPKISIVDFAEYNRYKAGWWDMHREMGVNVERVDGDARNLSKLIREANVVYAHVVLFSQNEGADIRQHLSHRRGEIKLSKAELGRLEKGFAEAEIEAIREACKVAQRGHVLWFMYDDIVPFFNNIAQQQSRVLKVNRVIRMCGEDPKDILTLYHLGPSQK